MIGHVFGLVGENISLLLTNQHLEEEAPIVENWLFEFGAYVGSVWAKWAWV